ncbi:MBL fold metallo-hydrolase [Lysobacter sp. LF1]|uniref:MBL fold metallo-hydrolase n=1 Tax=Lysobacter stagni TaxID=3045172 RepID=A0ABT6XCX9_9GAMM|nr:MBL fold metallo-hydrolase [Lysobacter sp. LF1]MDI9237998.1 MBL fold metallo-hydrolase [Lysobacter sp. LF1]
MPAPDRAPTEADGYFQRISRIDDGVWVIAQPQPFQVQPIGNVTVIEQADGLVLIDAGGSPGAGRRIVELVRSVSDKPVKAVAISHWHGDHVLGLSAIAREWPGVQVIATDVTASHLAGRSMKAYPKGAPDAALQAAFDQRLDGADGFVRDMLAKPELAATERAGFEAAQRLFHQYRDDTRDLYVVVPTRTFSERLRLDDAKRPVELWHPGRGNTDGDLVAWLPKQRAMVTGDLVVAPIPFGFNAYPAQWARSLAALKAKRPAVWIPGHGAPMRDAGYVDREIELIDRTRAAVAPLAKAGLTMEQTRAKVDLSAERAGFVGDDAWLSRWFDRYWTQPFSDAAYREATGQPIEQGEG